MAPKLFLAYLHMPISQLLVHFSFTSVQIYYMCTDTNANYHPLKQMSPNSLISTFRYSNLDTQVLTAKYSAVIMKQLQEKLF